MYSATSARVLTTRVVGDGLEVIARRASGQVHAVDGDLVRVQLADCGGCSFGEGAVGEEKDRVGSLAEGKRKRSAGVGVAIGINQAQPAGEPIFRRIIGGLGQFTKETGAIVIEDHLEPLRWLHGVDSPDQLAFGAAEAVFIGHASRTVDDEDEDSPFRSKAKERCLPPGGDISPVGRPAIAVVAVGGLSQRGGSVSRHDHRLGIHLRLFFRTGRSRLGLRRGWGCGDWRWCWNWRRWGRPLRDGQIWGRRQSSQNKPNRDDPGANRTTRHWSKVDTHGSLAVDRGRGRTPRIRARMTRT